MVEIIFSSFLYTIQEQNTLLSNRLELVLQRAEEEKSETL